MRERNYWNPIVLLVGGTVFGGAAAFSAVPAISQVSPEWISFFGSIAGGLVGGLLGIGAGWMAWAGVQAQLAKQESVELDRKRRAYEFARVYFTSARRNAIYCMKSIADIMEKSEISPDEFRAIIINTMGFGDGIRKSGFLTHALENISHLDEATAMYVRLCACAEDEYRNQGNIDIANTIRSNSISNMEFLLSLADMIADTSGKGLELIHTHMPPA